MTNAYTLRRLEQRTSANADQAEFSALSKSSATIEIGIFDDKIAGALDDFEDESQESQDRERWHQDDLKVDSAAGKVLEEIARRKEILGSDYPFEVKTSELIYKPKKTLYYEFCLSICLARSLTAGEYVNLPRRFERSSALLAEIFMGTNSQSLHTGAPRDESVGKGFKEAMRHLHDKSGEWFWGPEVDLPSQPTNEKDEGLDFVVWKTPPDKRIGRLFLIGQCACGDDWSDKFLDLDLRKIRKWFHPIAYVDPMRAFATPHVLSEGHFANAHREAGLTFDRLRLVSIAEQNSGDVRVSSWKAQFEQVIALIKKQQVEQLEGA
jgi:hypothetical protein